LYTLGDFALGADDTLLALKQVYLQPPGKMDEYEHYCWRDAVAASLGKMGPSGRTLLVQFLDDYLARNRDWGTKEDHYPAKTARAICEQLAKAGAESKAAAPVLLRLLDHKDREVRRDAAWALWRVARHPQSVPTLAKCLVFPYKSEIPTARKGTEVDSEVVKWFAEIGPEAREALPALEQLLKTVKNDPQSLVDYYYVRRDEALANLRNEVEQALRKIAPEKYGRTP
jgi:HEAT repeat protein